MKELHENNLQLCFDDAAFTELTRMILKGACHIKLDKIGKLLSAILERTDPLLRETVLFSIRCNLSNVDDFLISISYQK